MVIALVACAAHKQTKPAPAAQLYTSTLFRLAATYAKHNADAWYVLSAKHGLVSPEQVIAPYDVVLTAFCRTQRMVWAKHIADALLPRINPAEDSLVMLAGRAYREPLIPLFTAQGIAVTIPMEGLGIGMQLAWLKDQLRSKTWQH